ncbi:hypothetical protein BpHYR1_054561 [Brachionus plicatilis]|uniref:Uncharacterized protein n=1 Tax=Brachionus plicatilis TaxID=10195 RepID=A0A3M7SEW4_BRAPC|nr:hypothetical protein BpHYR1_054561 [Brachionus plicatilis]
MAILMIINKMKFSNLLTICIIETNQKNKLQTIFIVNPIFDEIDSKTIEENKFSNKLIKISPNHIRFN